MKLLVVDDDQALAGFVALVLEDEQHQVKSAYTISQAWAQLQEFTPDLIILDRGLPDDDGLNFCRELKSLKRCARVPVLFISAAQDPADIKEGLACGDGYLTKPFAVVDLVGQVSGLLRRLPPPAQASAT